MIKNLRNSVRNYKEGTTRGLNERIMLDVTTGKLWVAEFVGWGRVDCSDGKTIDLTDYLPTKVTERVVKNVAEAAMARANA